RNSAGWYILHEMLVLLRLHRICFVETSSYMFC
ncbi:hypothetical protein TVAGG3_0331430, partial [Trichomonas vaginalis G3]